MDGPGRRVPAVHALAGRPRGRTGARLRRLVRDTAAVTPLVGTILILAISAFGLGIVLAWGLPSMQQTQAEAEVTAVIDQFHALEEIVQNVMRSGASGKASGGTVSFSQGELKRMEGTLLVVTAHHKNTVVDDSHRYRATMVDAGDPYQLRLELEDGPVPVKHYLDVETVDPDTERHIGTVVPAGDGWDVTVAREDIEEGTLRLRVMHEAEPGLGEPHPIPVAQTWVFQLGSLEYTRQAPFGTTSVILEMGSVITAYESGKHVHTDPLVRQEKDAAGETTFLSMFVPVMDGGPHGAFVETTGPGSHPMRFMLALNMLQIPGQAVTEVDIHLVGDRAAVWYGHFEDRHGFDLVLDGEEILRGVVEAEEEGEFEFALMESRIEVEMQRGITRLDT